MNDRFCHAEVLAPGQIIDETEVNELLACTECGAIVCFSGIVRSTEEGQAIAALFYEHHEQMAVRELRKVLQASLDKFDILRAACVHRTGRVLVGETAVYAAVAAGHRAAAFEACEYIIGELKSTVPIWKSVTTTDSGKLTGRSHGAEY